MKTAAGIPEAKGEFILFILPLIFFAEGVGPGFCGRTLASS
jgi:hypothetical protein